MSSSAFSVRIGERERETNQAMKTRPKKGSQVVFIIGSLQLNECKCTNHGQVLVDYGA